MDADEFIQEHAPADTNTMTLDSLNVVNQRLEELKVNENFTNQISHGEFGFKGELHDRSHSAATDTNVTTCSNTKNCNNPLEPIITCCATRSNERFFKGCKWSPDEIGNRILTCDGNNRLGVYHCFLNKVDYDTSQISSDCVELRNIGKIFDYDWYPVISPSHYYAVIASSLGPLHIYDLMIQRCISSYQMFNTKDEAVYAHCVTCSPDGATLMGATVDYIFMFDVNQPGRTYDCIPTREYFRKGILSSIVVNPMRYSMFAVGSYNNRIGIYDEGKLLCLLNGHKKGITHLKFSPDGLILYSGARGNGELICWDLRNPGTALFKLERIVKTQQRIYFDVTSDSKYVLSGSTDGEIYIWDTALPPCGNTLLPAYKFQAHRDCANGISIHSKLPFIATTSGQYHNNNLSTLLRDYDSENDLDDSVNCQLENSLKLWHIRF